MTAELSNTELLERLDEARQALRRALNALDEAARQVSTRKPTSGSATGDSGIVVVPGPDGLCGAQARGEAQLVRWTKDGTLVPSATLAQAWHVTPQALQQSARRGELFSVKVAGKRMYLGGLARLRRQDVAQVCRLQRQLSAGEQLIFWLRPHGGLQGRNVAQMLEQGSLARVLEVARAWADERADDADSPA